MSLNNFPCNGFVSISAVIVSVGQCVTWNSPESRYCFMKKYLNFMCLVRSEQDLPLWAIRMVDVLSWYTCAWPIWKPKDIINCNSYATSEVASDSATNSDSVELLQTIFCFIDLANLSTVRYYNSCMRFSIIMYAVTGNCETSYPEFIICRYTQKKFLARVSHWST